LNARFIEQNSTVRQTVLVVSANWERLERIASKVSACRESFAAL